MARLVNCMEYARMASEMPGASLSATASVASGVRSLMEKPVPPVVSTRSTFKSSQSVIRVCSVKACSSGITR